MLLQTHLNKRTYFYFKARFGGLFCVFLFGCLVACSGDKPVVESKIKAPYQYPSDTIWRGLGLAAEDALLSSLQFPRYVDTLLNRADATNRFHYAYGIPNEDVPNKLLSVAKNQLARVYFLKGLGIPLAKGEAEKITYLNLSDRKLIAIPPEIGVLKNLKDLLLANNDIRNMSLSLLACRNLRRLDLSSNTLSNIPIQLTYLLHLEDLSLRDNRLNNLPGNFSQLRNLRYLDLSNVHPKLAKGHNDFKYIPPSVCHLPKLEKLLLEKLNISQLPISILYLKKLQVLSISGCRRINLNNTFQILAQMPELKVLDISFMGRSRLPNEIQLLKHLKVLIWQEEGNINKDEIQRLINLLPDTKIYHSGGKEPVPFLRGNSVKMLINAGKK